MEHMGSLPGSEEPINCLCPMNAVHALPFCIFKIHFNTITSMPRFSLWSSHVCHVHHPSHLLYLEDYAAGNSVSESSEVIVFLWALSILCWLFHWCDIILKAAQNGIWYNASLHMLVSEYFLSWNTVSSCCWWLQQVPHMVISKAGGN